MYLDLKDFAINICGFVSHCHCRCNHCLLCSGDGLLVKVSYEKLRKLALKFIGVNETHGINAALCVYNCSEYPELPEAIEVDGLLSTYSGYQNLNGTEIRKGDQLRKWVAYLKKCGIKHANISWFGMNESHDAFVNREGYFNYLMDLAAELKKAGIPWNNTVFLMRNNLSQLEQLTEQLAVYGQNIHYALFDYRGNAKKILGEYVTENDKARLPQFVMNTKVFERFRTEHEWIQLIDSNKYPKLSKRIFFLVATPENIDHYIQMTVDDILYLFHDMDSRLQNLIPSIRYLSKTYGDKDNSMLIDLRSVLWKWIDMHFDNNPQYDRSLIFSDLHTSVMWR